MSAGFLQNLEEISVTSQLEHADEQTRISSLEEVQDIVKNSFCKKSDLVHDENALDGYPDSDGVDGDFLDMMNLQLSNLVDLLEKDLTTEDTYNGSVVEEAIPESSDCNGLVKITPKRIEIPRSSEDLLQDITLVINNDTDFTSSQDQITSEKDVIELADKVIMCQDDQDVNEQCVQLPLATVHFNESPTLITAGTVKDLKELITFNKNYNNKFHSAALPADDIHLEQNNKESSEVDTSSEMLMSLKVPTISQEDSLEASNSLSNMTEKLLTESSHFTLHDLLSETLHEAAKPSGKSKLRSQLEADVTVDGEEGDSVELCQLSYDENLTCSFYELQLHQDDNSELLEHGQRGRPPRQKVEKPAVPCRIEPVMSQSATKSDVLQPQLLTPWQNFQPMRTSVGPTQLQPQLGIFIQRFPVVLHGDLNSSSKVYLKPCPIVIPSHRTSYADSVFSASSSELSSSSTKTTVTPSNTEVGSESKSSDPSIDVSALNFQDESSEIKSPVHHSVEIDGPIRHIRFNNIRNNSCMNMNAGNQGLNPEPSLAEPYSRQANLQGYSTGLSTNLAQSYGMEHRPFSSSGQNLIRPQQFLTSTDTMYSGLPYSQVGGQIFLHSQSSVQHNLPVQTPQRINELGTQGLPYQLPLQTDISGYAVGTFLNGPQFSNSSVEQAGNWRSEPNVNIPSSSGSLYFGRNDPPKYVCANGTSAYARRSGSPGKAAVALPKIPVDPLSRRVRILVGMGSQGQRQELVKNNIDYAAHLNQNPAALSRSSPLHEEHQSSKIQLSPPAELKKHEFDNEQHQSDLHKNHMHLPSGAAAVGSGIAKSQMHPKSVPSHSSTRSSKGPDIPVPVERSKTRVELWLNNNTMFRPDLDSGTYDPSDHSLIPEPSLPQTACRYPEQARNEQACEVVGLSGKRMVMVTPQPSPKQKSMKKGSAQNSHPKGSTQRHMFSDSSVLSDSSVGSVHMESSKDKFAERRQDFSIEYQDEHFVHPAGKNASNLFTDIRDIAGSNGKLPGQKIRNVSHQGTPCLVDQMDEKQKADLAIDEDMKILEQKSLEKLLAGFSSSSGSSHVLSEVEQYLLASDVKSDVKPSGKNASGNNNGSNLMLEAAIGGNSKQSSFDASKYITTSDIESLEKKKAQNGKSSLDGYLEHIKYCSNDSMSSLPNTSHTSDVKPLANILLNDIDEVIGVNGDLNQQPSVFDALYPPFSQPDHKQKAVKRRTLDLQEESAPQTLQAAAAGVSQNNQNIETFIPGLGLAPAMKTTLNSQQIHRGAKKMEHMKDQLASQGGNARDQLSNTYDRKGRTQEYIVGPPITQSNLLVQSSDEQAGFDQFQTSNFKTTVPGNHSTVLQIQQSNAFANLSEPPITLEKSHALNSSKTQFEDRQQRFSISGLPLDVEMTSSQEISQIHGLSLKHGLYKGQNISQSGLMPVSSAYFSNIQNILPSSAEKVTQAVLIPRPSSSSSLSSVSSASQMNIAEFKKPHSVVQSTSCSNFSSATAQRVGVPYYQSMGGDSDVSMSSDNSLSSGARQHDNMNIDQKEHISEEQYQLLQQQMHLQKIIHEQIIHERRMQLIQLKQQHVQNQQLYQQMENQQQQLDSQQQHQQLQNQQMQNQQQQMPNQQQQQHQQLQNQQQQMPNQQQQQHQQLPKQQMQNQQQQMPNQQQQQHQQLLNQQQQQMQNQQQQMQTYQQQQQQMQTYQQQQQQMQTYQQHQQQMQRSQPQQQEQVQNQAQQQLLGLHYQNMQGHQQHQQLIQNQQMANQEQQQVQKWQQVVQQQKHSKCLNPFTTAIASQSSIEFQTVPNNCRADVQPGNFPLSTTSQARTTMDPNIGLVVPQQPVSLLSVTESASSMQSSATGSNMLLAPHNSSQSQTCDSVHTITSHKINESDHHQAIAPNFSQTPVAVDENSSNRMNSLQQQSSAYKLATGGDQDFKSATESQLWKYLNGGFPSLDFVDFCPDSFSLSPNDPCLVQNKPQINLTNTSTNESLLQGDRQCAEKVQSGERSREQTDSDISVLSINSDVDMLSFQPDNDGETPLHLLCDMPKDWREKLSTLPSIPGFFDALNLLNKNQETALHIAVKNEDLEIVTFLVSHGADVNIYCISSQKGINSKTAHRNETVQQTALHEAVELGNTNIVKVLLTSQNVKVDAKRPASGFTPLMLALQLHRQSDRKNIIMELIKNQASLTLHDTIQSKTPLMYAIQSRDVSLVEQILQQVGAERARALVNDRAKKDMTCLHFAAELRLESSLKKRLLRCIIVVGGDASAKNAEGETPRDWAKADINEVLHNLTGLSSP